ISSSTYWPPSVLALRTVYYPVECVRIARPPLPDRKHSSTPLKQLGTQCHSIPAQILSKDLPRSHHRQNLTIHFPLYRPAVPAQRASRPSLRPINRSDWLLRQIDRCPPLSSSGQHR